MPQLCPECNLLGAHRSNCSHAASPVSTDEPVILQGDYDDASPVHINDRFPALSFISSLLRVIGWLIVAGGGFCTVVSVAKAIESKALGLGDFFPLFFSVAAIAMGALIVAAGECIGVLFAIEANTRLSAERLAAWVHGVPKK